MVLGAKTLWSKMPQARFGGTQLWFQLLKNLRQKCLKVQVILGNLMIHCLQIKFEHARHSSVVEHLLSFPKTRGSIAIKENRNKGPSRWLATPFHYVKIRGKRYNLWTRKWALTIKQIPSTLTLDFAVSRNIRNTLLLSISYPVSGIFSL